MIGLTLDRLDLSLYVLFPERGTATISLGVAISF